MKIKRIYIIDDQQNVLFKGNTLSLPYKRESIIEKSIELFNDHDPCVIHESYAIFQLSESFIEVIKDFNSLEILINDIQSTVPFIDFSNYRNALLKIEVK